MRVLFDRTFSLSKKTVSEYKFCTAVSGAAIANGADNCKKSNTFNRGLLKGSSLFILLISLIVVELYVQTC